MLRAIRNLLAFALLIAAGAALGRRDQALRPRRPRQRRRAADRDVAQGNGADRGENQGQERSSNCARTRPPRSSPPISRTRARCIGAAVAAAPKDAASWLALAQARRAGGRRTGGWPLRYGPARPDRRLRRLSARDRRRRSRPRRWRCSAISSPATRCGARRSTPIAPASSGATTKTRARSTRTCARSTASASSTTRSTTNPSSPRVCFNFSEPLARKTDFAPYVAVAGAAECGDLQRRSADLRRGPQARRALRDRRPRGPALGGRRVAAQGGRLRNLRARPLAAGAFRRQAPMCCRARASSARR